MSGKLLLKTMVLGTMTFSIYTIGMAAEVQDVNGLDSAQQTIASDTARKEAVRSSWICLRRKKVNSITIMLQNVTIQVILKHF